MRSSATALLSALGLACLVTSGCLKDLADLCQTDADCPGDQRCEELEGVKYCVGPSTGGQGGSAGVGGTGGAGGTGGTGGTGGAVEFEAVIELQLVPDAALTEYLAGAERRIGEVKVRYQSAGVDREVSVDLSSEPASLPLGPVEAPLPLGAATENTTLYVEAHAYIRDSTLARFATGDVTEELSAGARTRVVVTVSLDANFDWDLDTDPDATDCAPGDETISSKVFDVCDGERRGCGPYCFIELGQDETVRDLACSTVERKCAAVVQGPTASVVRIYDPTFPSTPVEVEGISEARGVAWNTFLSATHLMIAEPKLLAFAKPDGKLATGQIGTTVEISGRLHASIQGNIAVVPALDLPSIVVFDPSLAPARTGKVSCGGTGSACSTIALLNYIKSGDGEPLIPSDSNVVRAEAFRLDLLGDIAVHLQFRDFDKIGFLQLSGARVVQESGLLNVLGERRVPRLLASFGGDEWLFVASDALHAAWLQKGIDMSSHGSPKPIGLPDSACAASLDSQRSGKYLLLADDCNGSLWELPLDEEGRPTETEQFVQHPLGEHCNEPFILASLPDADGEPGVTFVGCRGKNHILVLDRS